MPQCENINIFGYLGGRPSIIRLGPYWFTSINSHILIYMSKYGIKLMRTFELKYKI